MGFGDDWQAAVEHVKTLAPPPGEKPWVIFDIAEYSEDFVEQMDAITVPPLAAEIWRLAMQTPERQLINPFFTGGEVTRVSYPTDGMSHDEKLMSMRGNTPRKDAGRDGPRAFDGPAAHARLSDAMAVRGRPPRGGGPIIEYGDHRLEHISKGRRGRARARSAGERREKVGRGMRARTSAARGLS